MKLLLINSSPRQKGSGYVLTREIKKQALIKKITCKIIDLKDMEYDFCQGCLSCEKTGKCGVNDNFIKIEKQIRLADTILFYTPNYFNAPSAQMKKFMDRTCCLCDYLSESHKEYAIAATGQADIKSMKSCYRGMKEYCDIMEIKEKTAPLLKIVSKGNVLAIDKEVQSFIDNLLKQK